MTEQQLDQNQPQPEKPLDQNQPQPEKPLDQNQPQPEKPLDQNQPQTAQPQPAEPQLAASKDDKAGTIALVCGICSFTGIIIALAGWVLGIVAIVFGVRGRKGADSGKATAGLVLGIIGLVIAVINSFAGAMMALN